MKNEDIEKAAVNYDSRAVTFRAFVAGAQWRINTVWHDSNEIPNFKDAIIVELFGELWDYGIYKPGESIDPNARWAYMSDLLPNKR